MSRQGNPSEAHLKSNVTIRFIYCRIGTIHEDVTTDVLGKIGCWQWLVTFVSTTLMMPAVFNQYEDIFLLQPSEVFCIPPGDLKIINSSLCSITFEDNGTEIFKCNKWHLKLLWLIWIEKTWLVFCDHNLKVLSTAIVSRFGLIFGCIIFGLVSDSFGRRTAVVIDVFAELVLGLVITFCDSEGWFRLIVFLKSLLGSANFYMGLVLVCEIASNSWRTWLCMIVISPRLIAMVCTVPLANSAPNSETYSFIACIFSLIFIALLRWSPESPQWLLYNRKIAVAETLLRKAAKRNGIKLCTDFKIRPVNHRAYNSLDETATCVGMLSIYNIRILFLVSTLFWSLYYFLWGSLYVRMYSEEHNLLKVFCFVTVLGCLTIFSSVKLMLRHLLLIHIVITGVFTVGVILFCKGTIRSFVSSIALASGIVVHALLLNVTPRLFGINIRATVVGCCHAAGQLGSTISYLLCLSHPMNDLTFLAVELGVTITLVGLCFVLPDVDNRELPDVTEDMDYFSELSKPMRWVSQKTSTPSLEEVEMRVHSFGSTGRSLSAHSHSQDRIPAQPIGCSRLWQIFITCVRKQFQRRVSANT